MLKEKAMMLISVLFLSLLMVILTSSMIMIVSESLNIAGRLERKNKAFLAAQAGINYAIAHLNNNSAWAPAQIDEDLGDGERFYITFSSFNDNFSVNNLRGAEFQSDTPPYSAKIIYKGIYKGETLYLQAILVRDDKTLYPVMSGGNIYIENSELLSITGEKPGEPGRIHSNSAVIIKSYGDYNDSGGFISTGDIKNSDVTEAMIKEWIVPEKLPAVDISGIIKSGRSEAFYLKPDYFYLAGYFEYETDPNIDLKAPYCIPHFLPEPCPSAPYVYTDEYKLGVIAFPEDSCKDFLKQFKRYFLPPANEFSNLFTQYSNVEMVSDFAGVEREEDNEIKVKLSNDILIDSYSANGICDIFTLRAIVDEKYDIFNDTKCSLDMNGHNIYGGKLYLATPPSGAGSIVSEKSIDLITLYDTNNLVLLSGESIRLVYYVSNTGQVFNGYLYAEDDIVIQGNVSGLNNEFRFNGKAVCLDKKPGNTCSEQNPFAWKPVSNNYGSFCVYSPPGTKIYISDSYTGGVLLDFLRENFFGVRSECTFNMK